MNNFFLVNNSLNTTTVSELEIGISNLNSILIGRNAATDAFMKHQSIWAHHNGHGYLAEFYYGIVSKEIQRLVPIVFALFIDYEEYIVNEIRFDQLFPNECNGFIGIDFNGITIPVSRQVNSELSLAKFKRDCLKTISYNSIQDFWNHRTELFPNLAFCPNVLQQLSNFSVTDDRFKLINEKLSRLNNFTGGWREGAYDYKNLGLDCSPDTPKRVKDTEELRTFNCPNIGDRIFSLHIKWSFGRQFFRLYFFPEDADRKVYVGYIGPKDDIGF